MMDDMTANMKFRTSFDLRDLGENLMPENSALTTLVWDGSDYLQGRG